MADDAVILWWGAELRMLDSQGGLSGRRLAESEDAVDAILRWARDRCPAGGTARLLYHPNGIEARRVGCPAGGRRRLRRALAEEFPDMVRPGVRWCASEPPAGSAGHAAVLHLDRSSALDRLSEGLGKDGTRLLGACPPLAALERGLDRAEVAGGFLAVAAVGRSVLISAADPAGGRQVKILGESDPADAAAAAVAALSTRFDEAERPAVLAVLDDGPCASGLRAYLPSGATFLPLVDWLAQARRLPLGGARDFLARDPRPWPRPTLRVAAVAAAAAMLAGAGWAAAANRRDLERLTDRRLAERQRLARSQERASSLRELRAGVDRVSSEIAAISGQALPDAELLRALSTETPPCLVLRSLSVEGDRFTIRGRACGGPAVYEPALRAFDRAMSSPGRPWKWIADHDSGSSAAAAFVRRGTLCPKAACSPAPPPP